VGGLIDFIPESSFLQFHMLYFTAIYSLVHLLVAEIACITAAVGFMRVTLYYA
jgi:hypothetical protein